ncbi:MAG: hypothetical protein HXM16_07540 [Fusobacterium periodonticum]|nr:hypothetical protein [Fusobacterium periodonticum]
MKKRINNKKRLRSTENFQVVVIAVIVWGLIIATIIAISAIILWLLKEEVTLEHAILFAWSVIVLIWLFISQLPEK